MSDRKETRIIPAVPAHEKSVVVGQDCDRCGKDVPKDRNYHRRDFELKFAEGDSYPEGTDLSGWQVPDLCDECVGFLKKLLEENGFKVQPYEVNY